MNAFAAKTHSLVTGVAAATELRMFPHAGATNAVNSVADPEACLSALAHCCDKDAFRILFSHFAPRIKAYLMRNGADAGTAEEVMQETMVNVWRKADQFDPSRASAATWIFTIARNRRIDRLRRERRPEFDPDDPAFIPDTEPDAYESLSLSRDGERLRRAVASLPEEQRRVLELAFFEEMSHAQVAEELDIPLGTVKSRIRLAFGKLRSELGDGE